MNFKYLSDEDMKVFKQYKHSADKTTLEKIYEKYTLGYVERLFPSVNVFN